MKKGKPTYAGRITNAGQQKVEALFNTAPKKGNSTVKRGEDLRSGK